MKKKKKYIIKYEDGSELTPQYQNTAKAVSSGLGMTGALVGTMDDTRQIDDVNYASAALTGAATGASLGSVVGPWGTVVGGVVGAGYGLVDTAIKDKELNKVMDAEQAMRIRQQGQSNVNPINYQSMFKTGGGMNLTRYVGNLHENGGIALGNTMNEVEGGETRGPKETPIKDYIFSDSLIIPGTKITFAKASKSIEDKYKRQNDKIENASKLRELSNLRDRQEGLRQEKGYSENKRYGGKIKLAGTGETSEVQDTSLDNYTEDSFTGVAIPWQDNMNVDLQNRIDEPNGNRINLSDAQRRNLGIAGSYLGQNVGNIYDIGVGLKGGDDVNFERVNPAYINLERAREDARKRAVLNRNIAMRNIRSVAPSAGSYLANIGAVTTGLNRQAGQEIGGLYTTEEMQNRQMDNMARSQNSQIQMREAIARQQEADSAKSAISSGLHGVGTTVGMATKDMRQEKVQSDMLSNFMGTENYKADGKGIYWVSGQTLDEGQYKGKQKYYDNKSGTWFIRDNKGNRVNINK